MSATATKSKYGPVLGARAESRDGNLTSIVEQNIKIVNEHRIELDAKKTSQDRIADAVTKFTGSMAFVYFHVVWFAIWILANVGAGGLTPFDPYPFGLLTTIVSLEAIFLSTFVLVSQNRQGALAEHRADLDLQINLLDEYEVTRILKQMDALLKHLGIEKPDDEELRELEEDIDPKAILAEIEEKEKRHPP